MWIGYKYVCGVGVSIMVNRRTVLRKGLGAVGVGSVVSISGCLNSGSGGSGGGNGSGGGEVGEFTIPNPEIMSVDAPEVRVTDGEEVSVSGDETEYVASLTNIGVSGDVLVEGYFVPGDVTTIGQVEDESELGKFSEEVVTFAVDETVEYSQTDVMPDEYEAFIYHTVPVSLTAVVQNTGGGGDVVVEAGVDEMRRKEVFIGEDSEKEVSVGLAERFNSISEVSVTARPADN